MTMKPVEGVHIDFMDEEYSLIRQYRAPKGWAITDAGEEEDQFGYYITLRVRGNGKQRNIGIVLEKDAINAILSEIIALENEQSDVTPYDTFTREVEEWGAADIGESQDEWNWDEFSVKQDTGRSCSDPSCVCGSKANR